MRDLAPQVFRQRLIVEAIYARELDAEVVEEFLLGLAGEMGLKVYGKPLVHSPAGMGSAANQGFDAFVPLIDSGISAYFWSQARLASVLVYSCKPFEPGRAAGFVRRFLQVSGEVASRKF